MLKTYTYPKYTYRKPPELGAAAVRRVPLVVVGAGPVGLAAAIDAARQGIPVVLLDEDDTVSIGSRGVCYAKRALEVLDRLGVGDAVVAKGVTWNVGRTFHRDTEVFSFNLQPEAGHHRPGMVNLQQYWLEQYLVERAQQLGALDLRWRHKVTAVSQGAGRAVVDVETVDGTYRLETDWLVVADGARSPIRRMMGLDVEGKVFQDRFLIADIVLDGELFPKDQTERWFWFDPPFHGGQGVHPDQRMPGGTSVLLHREADNVWRIDFQLGWSADPEAEKAPERVIPRVRAALDSQGFRHVGFELEWVSVYTFQCRRMKDFRAGRVLFVGDAAHQVSPFGARGANSGLQDADNLVWKLRLVIDGRAPERLLDTYSDERIAAADENILNSTRATDFITPKSHVSQVMRNAVLTLARQVPCGRALVNSGRLSVPSTLDRSTLNTPDRDRFGGWMVPGAPIDDAPVRTGGRDGWLLAHVADRFTMLLFAAGGLGAAERAAVAALERDRIPVHTVAVVPAGAAASAGIECVEDVQGLAGQRFDAQPGTAYLLRPDQHVAARWRDLDVAAVRAAVARATCNG